MPRPSSMLSILPATLLSVTALSAVALFTLLKFPEAMMRYALTISIPEDKNLSSNTSDIAFADEILHGTELLKEGGEAFQPVGLIESFDIGDRIRVKHAEGGARTFVVTDVRRLQPIGNDLDDNEMRRMWSVVIFSDQIYPDSDKKYRLIIDEGMQPAFRSKKPNAHAL